MSGLSPVHSCKKQAESPVLIDKFAIILIAFQMHKPRQSGQFNHQGDEECGRQPPALRLCNHRGTTSTATTTAGFGR